MQAQLFLDARILKWGIESILRRAPRVGCRSACILKWGIESVSNSVESNSVTPSILKWGIERKRFPHHGQLLVHQYPKMRNWKVTVDGQRKKTVARILKWGIESHTCRKILCGRYLYPKMRNWKFLVYLVCMPSALATCILKWGIESHFSQQFWLYPIRRYPKMRNWKSTCRQLVVPQSWYPKMRNWKFHYVTVHLELGFVS